VQVSAGGVDDLRYHVVWCPKFHRPFCASRSAARCEDLIRARASAHAWLIVALEIMPGHVHSFVKAHLSDSPSSIASQFTGFTSRRLRAELPHMRSRFPDMRSRSYFAATIGAAAAQTVHRHLGTQHWQLWRKERPQ
jgi:putative transposase